MPPKWLHWKGSMRPKQNDSHHQQSEVSESDASFQTFASSNEGSCLDRNAGASREHPPTTRKNSCEQNVSHCGEHGLNSSAVLRPSAPLHVPASPEIPPIAAMFRPKGSAPAKRLQRTVARDAYCKCKARCTQASPCSSSIDFTHLCPGLQRALRPCLKPSSNRVGANMRKRVGAQRQR